MSTSSSDAPLPQASRPTATAPGHWVLARAGKRVLRPGGADLTSSLLAHAHLKGADVVEFAPGLGRTASEIMAAAPASYMGIDQDPDAARRVGDIVGARGTVRQGDAASTGLPDACADTVVGEAMLTMQGDKGKASIVAEAARLLRPGGRYAIHELAVTPDDIDPEIHTDIRKALARAIHVNARPMTAAQWADLLRGAGLEIEWMDTAPMALLKMGRNIRDEGIIGTLRILRNVLADKELRQRIMTMRKTFAAHEKSMCGIAIVARKPEEPTEEKDA
ncbi:MAG: class I SAM-dependent methyltransferase [Actinomycetaceae bacterium]|nr:class I SAM-dependent methyltransferase [Actinomycetaceae bacterium]